MGDRLFLKWCAGAIFLSLFLPLLTRISHAAEAAAARPQAVSERDAAQRVDRALLQASDKGTPLPPLADDEAFLRRVCLDLTGKLPSPKKLRRSSPTCRSRKAGQQIERLLAGNAYAVNWARYWRDVVTYHTPASGNYLRWQLFDEWMVEQFRRNRPWDDIVTALVTAIGDQRRDRAGQLPDAAVRQPGRDRRHHQPGVPRRADSVCRVPQRQARSRGSASSSTSSSPSSAGPRSSSTRTSTAAAPPTPSRAGREGQYQMTDKKDPSRLIAMQPRFLTGEAVSLDADDEERRAALARFLTSPKNPWFARSLRQPHVDGADGLGLLSHGHRPRLRPCARAIPRCSTCLARTGRVPATTCAGCSARWRTRRPTSGICSPGRQSERAVPVRSARAGSGPSRSSRRSSRRWDSTKRQGDPGPGAELGPGGGAAHRAAPHGLSGVQGESVAAGRGSAGYHPAGAADDEQRPGQHLYRGQGQDVSGRGAGQGAAG